MNLGIIRRETQAHLCFVSESHNFTSVYLGMEGSATSCNRELRPVQTWDTEVKPGVGGYRQSVGKSLWKNLLHHQDRFCNRTSQGIRSLESDRTQGICAYTAKWKHNLVLFFLEFHKLCLWRKADLLLKLLSHVKTDTGILQAHQFIHREVFKCCKKCPQLTSKLLVLWWVLSREEKYVI